MERNWKAKDVGPDEIEGSFVTVRSPQGSLCAIEVKTADGYRYYPCPHDEAVMNELAAEKTPWKRAHDWRPHTLGEVAALIKPAEVVHRHVVEVQRR
ncbi:hypothetical protein [Methyloceanibacter sp. wino2]|uniref:hypothetical protein n=1 Tax=Methyloceanibacter sp. wino2 TaxID=2170729 RepID=UPI000D3E393E|nr:hypothetical protein [Methyloceanibacter sp. wino2]